MFDSIKKINSILKKNNLETCFPLSLERGMIIKKRGINVLTKIALSKLKKKG